MLIEDLPGMLEGFEKRLALLEQSAANGGARYLNLTDAAEYVGLTVQALRSAEKRGQLQFLRPYGRSKTGRVLVERSELDRFAQGV